MSFRKVTSNARAGVETRPYKRGAESSPPTLAFQFARSVNNPQHQFVILNEVKDLKQHKIKIYAAIFFAYRRRRTNGRARPLQKILSQLL